MIRRSMSHLFISLGKFVYISISSSLRLGRDSYFYKTMFYVLKNFHLRTLLVAILYTCMYSVAYLFPSSLRGSFIRRQFHFSISYCSENVFKIPSKSLLYQPSNQVSRLTSLHTHTQVVVRRHRRSIIDEILPLTSCPPVQEIENFNILLWRLPSQHSNPAACSLYRNLHTYVYELDSEFTYTNMLFKHRIFYYLSILFKYKFDGYIIV